MTKTTLRKDIIDGLRVGFPIAMGYFAVAFSLGIIAVQVRRPMLRWWSCAWWSTCATC